MGIKKIKTRPKKMENKKEVSADRYGKNKVNHLGYPHDDPYGLSEAFWKIFTKHDVTDKKRN